MSSYVQALLADVGIGVLGGLSVYVILAVGQLSLGNAAFMAIGAYVASMLTVWNGWALAPALAVGALASGVVGLLVGFPALRLRGIYLAVATRLEWCNYLVCGLVCPSFSASSQAWACLHPG